MKKIISLIKCYFGISKLSSQITVIDVRISKIQKKKKKSDRELQNYKDQLSGIKEEFNQTMIKTNQALDRSAGIQKSLELSLQAAQEEIKIAKEITIPGLVASHQLLISRWESETAVETMKLVAIHNPRETE